VQYLGYHWQSYRKFQLHTSILHIIITEDKYLPTIFKLQVLHALGVLSSNLQPESSRPFSQECSRVFLSGAEKHKHLVILERLLGYVFLSLLITAISKTYLIR